MVELPGPKNPGNSSVKFSIRKKCRDDKIS